MSLFRTGYPSSIHKIYEIPGVTQENFDAIEDWSGIEHSSLTSASSGQHVAGGAGVVYVGKTLDISELSPASGAMVRNRQTGTFGKYDGLDFYGIWANKYSRARATLSGAVFPLTADWQGRFDCNQILWDSLHEFHIDPADALSGSFTPCADGFYHVIASFAISAANTQVTTNTSRPSGNGTVQWIPSGYGVGYNYKNVWEYPSVSDEMHYFNESATSGVYDSFNLSPAATGGPAGSSSVVIGATWRVRLRNGSCACNNTCYHDITTCTCNNSCYEDTACTSCDMTCYQQGSCTCNNSCYGQAGCTCNNTCYSQTCTTCNATCYSQTCTCNYTLYGPHCNTCYITCYWFAWCKGDQSCTCDNTCYGGFTCTCNNSCYGQSCTCNSTCYQQQCASCYNTCYGYSGSCTCNSSCYGQGSCTCNNSCYGDTPCSCDVTTYGYSHSCECDASQYLGVFQIAPEIYDSALGWARGTLTSIAGTAYGEYTYVWDTDPFRTADWTAETASGITSIAYRLFTPYTAACGVSADVSQFYLSQSWFPVRPVLRLQIVTNEANASSSVVAQTQETIAEAGAESYQTVSLSTIVPLKGGDRLSFKVRKTRIDDMSTNNYAYSFVSVHRLGGQWI